jgi:hypothetical protein
MQTQSVQKCRQSFHDYKNSYGKSCPGSKQRPRCNCSNVTFNFQSHAKQHVPQHFRKLWNYTQVISKQLTIFCILTRMGKRQSPQTQIGSCVRNCTQYIFYRVDGLMDEDLTHRFFLFFVMCRRCVLLRFGILSQLHPLIHITVTSDLKKKSNIETAKTTFFAIYMRFIFSGTLNKKRSS